MDRVCFSLLNSTKK